jgi:hypothetical protein
MALAAKDALSSAAVKAVFNKNARITNSIKCWNLLNERDWETGLKKNQQSGFMPSLYSTTLILVCQRSLVVSKALTDTQ